MSIMDQTIAPRGNLARQMTPLPHLYANQRLLQLMTNINLSSRLVIPSARRVFEEVPLQENRSTSPKSALVVLPRLCCELSLVHRAVPPRSSSLSSAELVCSSRKATTTVTYFNVNVSRLASVFISNDASWLPSRYGGFRMTVNNQIPAHVSFTEA
jgi:hypothetical protein